MMNRISKLVVVLCTTLAFMAMSAVAFAAWPSSWSCEDFGTTSVCDPETSSGWTYDTSAGNQDNHHYINSTVDTMSSGAYHRWWTLTGDFFGLGSYYDVEVFILGGTYPQHFSSTSVRYYFDGNWDGNLNQSAYSTNTYVLWATEYMTDEAWHRVSTDGYCGPCIGSSTPYKSGADAARFTD